MECTDKKGFQMKCRGLRFNTPTEISLHLEPTRSIGEYRVFLDAVYQVSTGPGSTYGRELRIVRERMFSLEDLPKEWFTKTKIDTSLLIELVIKHGPSGAFTHLLTSCIQDATTLLIEYDERMDGVAFSLAWGRGKKKRLPLTLYEGLPIFFFEGEEESSDAGEDDGISTPTQA